MDSREELLARAKELLARAGSVAVLTGAGISAESGVPVFRGSGGLWRSFRPEELATPEAFQRDPGLVWEWYSWRRELIAQAQPNAGHRALAEFERRISCFHLVTQNVDGLHERAGSRNVIQLHGDIWINRCTRCGAERRAEAIRFEQMPPRCACGALERPGVVWFGEPLPAEAWEKAQQVVRDCEVFLVVGTSAVVYPAAGLVPLAAAAGASVIEINQERTPASDFARFVLEGAAGEILSRLMS